MLTPEEGQNSKQQTKMIPAANAGEIREEIAHEINPGDGHKRLAVSAWLKDANKSTSEHKGCMSFGIKNLLSKNKKKEIPVDDWYSFLPDSAGKNGHQMSSESMLKEPSKENKSATANLHKKIQDHQKFTVTIPKCSSGFGFTIKGSGPVRVGRVKPDGTAEKYGLQAGDVLLNINNRDISLSSLDLVTKIIRNASEQLQLVMARPPTHKGKREKLGNSAPGCLPGLTACGPSRSSSAPAGNMMNPAAAGDKGEMTAAERITNWGLNLSKSALVDINNKSGWQPELSVINEEKSPDVREQSAYRNSSSSRYMPTVEPIYEEISSPTRPTKRTPSWNSLTPETASSCDPDSYTSADNTAEVSRRQPQPLSMSKLHNMWTYYENEIDSSMCSTAIGHQRSWLPVVEDESRRYGPFTSEEESSIDEGRRKSMHSNMSGGEIPCSADREVAIHQLLTCEEDFARLMKRGIQRFSRPLRHQILSRQEHAAVFQNIEKLVALTEFHIRNMTESSFSAEDSYMSANNNINVEFVGSIYKPKIRMVCEVYKMYCEGLGRALELLDSLRQLPDFYKFQQRTENLRGFELTMAEFLQHPMAHFQQLVGSLGRVLLTTPQDHPDYVNIKSVIEVVHMSVTSPQNSSRMQGSQSHAPPHPHHRPQNSHCPSMSSSAFETTGCTMSPLRSRDLSASRSSLSSVDGEILDIQQKLSFAKHVKPFTLATPHRHVIFSGELLCDAGDTTTTLWAILCSDLLLLTQKDDEGHMKVMEALHMHQIVDIDFNCEHDSEFSLITSAAHQGTPSNSTGVLEFRLRTSNMEQKYTWKTLIEQRIKTCKSQTDSAFSSTEEFV